MDNNENEIIYISSDDDEDAQKKKNKKLGSSEQLKVNACSKDDIQNDHQYEQIHQQKRKYSEVNNSNGFDWAGSAGVCDTERSAKIRKLDMGQEATDGEKKRIKPRLVVKEKKSVYPMEQDVFPMFISLCLQKDHSDDMRVIVSKLKRRYEQLTPEYANSEAFRNFLNEKRNDIINSKHKLYAYIAEVMIEMKNSCKGKSTLLLDSKRGSDANCTSETNIVDASRPRTSHANAQQSRVPERNDEAVSSESAEENDARQKSLKNKMRLIEVAMRKCRKYIKKYEEAEVDFDDENNSNYIKLEKYKHRMIELYNKYCKYSGENADADRQYLRPKHFSPTGILSVDHAITSFINSQILERNKVKKVGAFTRALVFPDYHDILECVKRCNETNNLNLNNRKQQQLARKAFTEIGEHLQLCRRNDYWDTFSMFLENQEEDPAVKDQELAERLRQNKLEGEQRLASVFQEYVVKQEEMKDEIVDSKTSSERESEEDESENENEDDYDDDVNDHDDDKDASEIDAKKLTVVNTVRTNQVINDTSKDSNNRPEQENVSDKKVNNGGSNRYAKSIVEKAKAASSDPTTQLNTSSKVVLLITTNNDISINETKGEKSMIATEEVSDEMTELKEETDENKKGDKPLLRLRSFAKPPTTWEDNQGRIDSQSKTPIVIVDLTQSSPTGSSVVPSKQILTETKLLPLLKDYKMVMLPAASNKNIAKACVMPGSSTNVNKLERGEIAPPQQIRGKPSAKATIIHSAVIQRKKQTSPPVIDPLSNEMMSATMKKYIHPQHPQNTYSANSKSS